jgi:hypothetical protein
LRHVEITRFFEMGLFGERIRWETSLDASRSFGFAPKLGVGAVSDRDTIPTAQHIVMPCVIGVGDASHN